MKKQSLVTGASILAIAAIFVKVLGMFFRLPLVNWIGDTGMANYGPAYYIYSFLVILATSGLPVAISKMVSESIAIGNYYQAHKVFRISSKLMRIMGIIFAVVLFVFAGYIADIINNPDAALGMRVLAPALIFVPIMASYRGYFQGMQNMKPTAISQVVEQFFRVIVGLGAAYVLFYIWQSSSHDIYDKYARGAAGAVLGATAGAFAGLILILFIYKLAKKNILQRVRNSSHLGSASNKEILKRVLIIAIPITIGAAIVPLMNLVDSAIVMKRLTEGAGFTQQVAKELYGQLSGFVGPLVNIPQVLIQAVGVSIVPIIAAAYKMKNRGEINKNVNLGIRISIVVGYPCAVGLIALAKPILLLLYPNQQASAANATSILIISGIGLFFFTTVQILTSILQGVGKQMIPATNLLIGIVLKIVLTWILVGICSINVDGAVIANVVAFGIAMVLNLRALKKYLKVKLDVMQVFVKPLFSAAVMGVITAFVYKFGYSLVHSNIIITIVSVVIAVVVYIIMIFITKVVSLEELKLLPKGEKLVKIASKFIKK